jgi:hypothetical protein
MVKRNWKETPRGDSRTQWSGLYVTLNGKGVIVMGRIAYERLGAPKAFLLLYDAANHTVGLKPSTPLTRNSYPVGVYGRHGGRRINAYRLLKEHAIIVNETVEFRDAEIDDDGILVLNMRTAVISNRALRHPTKRKSNAENVSPQRL